MLVGADGTGLITAGLDHWFDDEDAQNLDISEFALSEWRLVDRLNVDHFRVPPDYRDPYRGGGTPNVGLKVPFLRFPQWHFCPTCKRMNKLPLSARKSISCSECKLKKRTRYLVQVPFVAMCERGHLQDFPWREWVHRSATPTCDSSLRLLATGGASLGAQKVICDCGAQRTLFGITTAFAESGTTLLSDTLLDGDRSFLCQGKRPWLGTEEGESCDRPLRGTLRSASNVYYADVKSAIYLPRGDDSGLESLLSILERPPFSTFITLVTNIDPGKISPRSLREVSFVPLQPYTDSQLVAAIEALLSPKASDLYVSEVDSEDQEIAFRRAEFNTLRVPREDPELNILSQDLESYVPPVADTLAKLMLVPKLRETRAFAGFSRIYAERTLAPAERRNVLWRNPPRADGEWLPAYNVFGEGVYLELDEERLRRWEVQEDVVQRIRGLNARYNRGRQDRNLAPRDVTARFVLLHTLSHLLMNRLTFECGYSSASLRERLYVSAHPVSPMAGVLIYTAAGDAEGTLGGLVRMGRPGYLEPVISRALDEARWCSVDPVCMELGAAGGQGPNSCNLAACHNCALVPETACEEFNQLLDRALVVGVPGNRTMGYFDI
jgi:hypothetical protein